MRTANLCYSPDAFWRRALSRAMIRAELVRARGRPLLRLSLHPQDVRSADVMAHWRTLVAEALDSRTPVTKERWVASLETRACVEPATADSAPTEAIL